MQIQIFDDESVDDLQLNNLYLIQKKSGFKFGVDAVLLSDFAKDTRSNKTLDLCTGSGIVPILLSAKTKTRQICGIEIQEDVADMANRSVLYNGLQDRVFIECGNLNNATKIHGKQCFDCITCNPPYMKSGSAILNQSDNKVISRHEVHCTLDDVVSVSSKLLVHGGHFFMIHRPSRLVDILCTMRKYRLEPKKIRFIHSTYNKAPNLVLVEGVLFGGEELKMMTPLYVYNTDGSYTDEINTIYERK